MTQRGRFISFEGSEGCGKTTQIRRLRDRLRSVGIETLVTREPGGTRAGEVIRELLKHSPEGEGLTPEAELLLFAASRAQLVREVVEPALARGTWVLADRFLDSTTVYQGIARGLERASVEAINHFAVGSCLPHKTLLLDLPVGVGRQRSAQRDGGRRDRMERESDAFFEKVREGYLELAKTEPERIEVLDAALPVEELAERIASSLGI